MNLSGLSRDMASKGSTANGSLSFGASRVDDCDCYCEGWFSRGGFLERSVCPRSYREV